MDPKEVKGENPFKKAREGHRNHWFINLLLFDIKLSDNIVFSVLIIILYWLLRLLLIILGCLSPSLFLLLLPPSRLLPQQPQRLLPFSFLLNNRLSSKLLLHNVGVGFAQYLVFSFGNHILSDFAKGLLRLKLAIDLEIKPRNKMLIKVNFKRSSKEALVLQHYLSVFLQVFEIMLGNDSIYHFFL